MNGVIMRSNPFICGPPGIPITTFGWPQVGFQLWVQWGVTRQVEKTITDPWADVLFDGNGGNEIMICTLVGFSESERKSGLRRVTESLFRHGFSKGDAAGFIQIAKQRNRRHLTSGEVHQIAPSVWMITTKRLRK